MRVVVCGGGIIGAAIAYYLSRRGVAVVVVERTGVACAASGKSGGFLALDWCDSTPLEPLARRSFALHAALPDELACDWGYRRVGTHAGYADEAEGGGSASGAGECGWLSAGVTLNRRLGSRETTAQVHPGAFTAAMMRAAEANGAELRAAEVTGVLVEPGPSRVGGVALVGGDTIVADAVVVAMGPWSSLAAAWLPLPRVYGLKGHSLVFETGDRIPAEALFLEYLEATGEQLSPEVFPRADGTTYVCAISSQSPLPLDPGSVEPDPGAIDRLHALCSKLSPVLASARVLARQACFRPIAPDGLPLIGGVDGVAGAYVATGHSVWGILNAPATGEAMAELIVDGRTLSVDLSSFDPARFYVARAENPASPQPSALIS
jgi:glycine/D-amino acid oxidase-like deaminating enzyme